MSTAAPSSGRTSGAVRIIAASPDALYGAFTTPELLVQWLPPGEMSGQMHAFDGTVGGGYEMSLYYPPTETGSPGKTAEREDRVRVRFVELVPNRRIVEVVTFATEDPALKSEMTLTVTFEPAAGGTRVALAFADLPPGLRPEDNDEGARLSLEQLARRFEG